MRLKSRLENLEKRFTPSRFGEIPFGIIHDDPGGAVVDGEFVSWRELYERYPEAPKVLHWSDDERFT